MLPQNAPPQRVAQKVIFVGFLNTIQFQSNKVCYKVSLCENFQQQSCSRTIPLCNIHTSRQSCLVCDVVTVFIQHASCSLMSVHTTSTPTATAVLHTAAAWPPVFYSRNGFSPELARNHCVPIRGLCITSSTRLGHRVLRCTVCLAACSVVYLAVTLVAACVCSLTT